jgi:hypothetical protein
MGTGPFLSFDCFKDEKEMVVSGMRKYLVEVGLKGSSLRIEAKDQIEAIRLAKDAVLEDGLLIFVQRDPAEDEDRESTILIWRPGRPLTVILGEE